MLVITWVQTNDVNVKYLNRNANTRCVSNTFFFSFNVKSLNSANLWENKSKFINSLYLCGIWCCIYPSWTQRHLPHRPYCPRGYTAENSLNIVNKLCYDHLYQQRYFDHEESPLFHLNLLSRCLIATFSEVCLHGKFWQSTKYICNLMQISPRKGEIR